MSPPRDKADEFIEEVKEALLRAKLYVDEAVSLFVEHECKRKGADHDVMEMAITMALARKAARIKIVHLNGKILRKTFMELCGAEFTDALAEIREEKRRRANSPSSDGPS